MISLQVAQNLKKIVRNNVNNLVKPEHIYLYRVSEKLNVQDSLPIIKITHATTTTRGHFSDTLHTTKERLQIQFYFDDEDDADYEGMIANLEQVLEEEGFYFSTGYDSFDPDYEGLLTITRQYNYRNQLKL